MTEHQTCIANCRLQRFNTDTSREEEGGGSEGGGKGEESGKGEGNGEGRDW